ncbi:hypothetical protein K1719_035388 [Acacia pycnantha]|nr:hypothetical protein K1719_035388 [Acacia pycnantha]
MNLSGFFSFVFTLLILHFEACKALTCRGPLSTITVSQSGNAQFKTIQSAIDSVSNKTQNIRWVRIKISPGVYRQQIIISRLQSCIYLEGAGSKSTFVQWNGHDTPFTTPTFISKADDIAAKGITFMNTFNRPVDGDEVRLVPAEAARIEGDECAFFECAFLGVQDTLNDHYGRHYFHKCFIQGAIDFIYGGGQSLYEECTLFFSVGRDLPEGRGGVFIAQKRESRDDGSAFVFYKCNITGNGKGKAYLGRGYRPYSRVIIADSYIGDVVSSAGWDPWWGRKRVQDLTFVEEGCWGPGSRRSKRVPWMKRLRGSALRRFVDKTFIDRQGWITRLPVN